MSSLKKQSKEVLQENTVISMSLVYEDGSKKVMNLEGQELSSKAAKRLLESIKWDSVAEVTFEVDEDERDGEEGADDEDDDVDYDLDDYLDDEEDEEEDD
ncbi:hypothetical protein PAT3040_06454 [Paenibacillus agaridevorans]|uniref:Uncharacterized protein n=1 Tax=Paenibacillus agaridevorans TaxID=171404 RepID=A0A2R5F4N5_9BACL|nr:hypothetical protein [Paenibacillus agaridevorans]GBG11623.1 hypothetical protein PAT3040_06454 [Paenibacillus agaridevorans]